LYIGLFSAAQFAGAQNLVENPSFDADASSWMTPPSGVWSVAQDHTGGNSGSLQMTTSSFAEASQCIVVVPNQNYEFAAWIEQDPFREFDPCPTPEWGFRVSWHSDLTCQAGNFVDPLEGGDGPFPLGWEHHTFEVTAPPAANSVRVALDVGCKEQHGTSIFYFDDVSFTRDAIFKGDFEITAPGIGPGSG